MKIIYLPRTILLLHQCLCHCRENFIQLDVYYRELSYEKIDQQVAFERLSLLSEVGGFMGLLLGASVLTVFELIDFGILSLLARCKRSGAINP